MLKYIYEKLIGKSTDMVNDKYDVEAGFWRNELKVYVDWYSGKIPSLYDTGSPRDDQKVMATNQKDSAVLTWLNLHQKVKYLRDLELGPDAFSGLTVLDVGAGPLPSGLCFQNCRLYCLDPLYHKYLEIGFPLHYYGNVRFIHAHSENIPIDDNFFDAVISVNAIDHVDDLLKTSNEIKRTLKKGGRFAMHVHYHRSTAAEPLQVSDQSFLEAFGWCDGIRKVKSSTKKMGHALTTEGEIYTLWKNF